MSKTKNQKSYKLALKHGEGDHTHMLVSKKPFLQKSLGENSFALELSDTASVVHEEHGEIKLSMGNYITCSQSEFDPLVGNYRQVFD